MTKKCFLVIPVFLIHLLIYGQSDTINAKQNGGKKNFDVDSGVISKKHKNFTVKRNADSAVVEVRTSGAAKASEISIHAEYKDGFENFQHHILEYLKFPQRCYSEGLEAVLKMQFMVDENGKISTPKALNPMIKCPEFEKEAIDLLLTTNGNWIAAKNKQGKKVKSFVVISITFSLDSEYQN